MAYDVDGSRWEPYKPEKPKGAAVPSRNPFYWPINRSDEMFDEVAEFLFGRSRRIPRSSFYGAVLFFFAGMPLTLFPLMLLETDSVASIGTLGAATTFIVLWTYVLGVIHFSSK